MQELLIDYISVASFRTCHINCFLDFFLIRSKSFPLSGYLPMPIENSILYDESINLQCHEIWVLICSKNARNLTSLLMFLIAIMYLKSFRRPNTPRSSIAFNMVSSITYVILWHSSSVCVALNCSILSTSRYISESWQLLSDSMFLYRILL